MSLATKLANFRAAIKQNGGFVGSYLKLFRQDEIKFGECVGEDKFGNKYFYNKYYMLGRSRWVEYSPQYGHDYDGSHVPAEWHRWLSYISDETPVQQPPIPRKWRIDHIENKSGTNEEFVPYSTTKPKIEAWQPPKA